MVATLPSELQVISEPGSVMLIANLLHHQRNATASRPKEIILKALPLEVIELIGQHLTIDVAVHGLIWRSASLLSEGVPPNHE